MADGTVIIDSKLDSKGLESGLAKLGKLGGSLAGTAAKGIAAVSAGLLAAGGAATSAGMAFDTAMSQVAATMGKSVDEIQNLSDVAKKMGETTKFSANEAAQALNYLALAGYDADTAADTLPAVLNLAAAGSMDLAYASDLATDAMSALGIAASQENLTKFGDEMAMTASKANTSVAQLGEAILTVGGTAKTLKGDTVELNTALGVLANRGIKGAEGGTHLRNVILALTAPTKKSAAALKSLGISATDSTGEMRPLNEILKDFNKALDGMTDAQKTEALNEIFNKTDIAAVQGLLAGCGEEWDNLADAIDNAGGAMQKMADTQIDNLEGDITILKSALEGLGIAAYEGFRSPLREIVQLGQSLVGELTDAMKSGGFEGLASALGDVVARGIDAVAGYAPKVLQLATRVIKGFCEGLRKNVKQVAGTLKNILVSAVSGISETMPALIEAGMQIMVEFINSLADALPTLVPKLIEGIGNAIAAVAANAGAILKAGIQIAQGLFLGIMSALPALVQSLFGVFSGLWKSITGLFEGTPPETTVTVRKSEPDGKLSDLKIDLDNLPKDVVIKTTVTQSGALITSILLQSIVDKNGKTVELFAECDEEGNVTGFKTVYDGVESKTIDLTAVPWGEDEVGNLKATVEDAHGNTITLTAQKDDKGRVGNLIAEINGVKSKEITVTGLWAGVEGMPDNVDGPTANVKGAWDGSGIPDSVSVGVLITGAENAVKNANAELESAKQQYFAEAFHISVTYDSAQNLINELETIKSTAGTVKPDLTTVAGFSSNLAGMSTSLGGIAGKMGDISSNPKYKFTDATKDAWAAVAKDITTLEQKATSLGSDLGGITNAEFPEMANLTTAASNAGALSSGLLNAANNLDDLAKNPNLQEGRKTFLDDAAANLRDMAEKAGTIETELTNLAGKQYLSEEDKERMVELTNQLAALYPELANYIGSDGVLALEAEQVRDLTEQYRQLALAKAAGQYLQDAGAALVDAQYQHELLRQGVIDAEQQKTALEGTKTAWEGIADAAAKAAEAAGASQLWSEDGLPSEEEITAVTDAMRQFVEAGGTMQQLADSGVDLSAFIDENGHIKDTATILDQCADNAQPLYDALNALNSLSLGKVDELNGQLEKVDEAVTKASDALAENQPKLEAAQAEYDKVARALERTTAAAEAYTKATETTDESGESAAESAADTAESMEEAAEAAKTASEEIGKAGEKSKTTVESLTHDTAEVQETAATLTETVENLKGAQSAADTLKTQLAGLEPEAKAAYDKLVVQATNTTLLAQSMVEACKGAWSDEVLATFLDIGEKIIANTNSGIEKNAVESNYSSSAGKAIEAAKNAFETKIGPDGSRFKYLGKMIAKGIAAGIDENTSVIVEAAKKALEKAIAAAKEQAGISSPSTVWRDTIGQWIPKGVAAGIDENSYAIADSVTRMMDQSIGAAENLAIAERMRSAVDERNSITLPYEPAGLPENMDYDALASAVWEHMPEDFSVNQTINFNRPMQAPDEIAREIRRNNTYGLIGGRG